MTAKRVATPDRPVVARVTHGFSASPERVFDAWLDPDRVSLWWRAAAAAAGRGATETLERVRIEARVGGSFSFLVRRSGALIDHTGTYLEIERPRRLVFTWSAIEVEQVPPASAAEESPNVSRVIIEIAATPSGCELTLEHEMHHDWADFVDRAVNAWTLMLEAIDGVLGADTAGPED